MNTRDWSIVRPLLAVALLLVGCDEDSSPSGEPDTSNGASDSFEVQAVDGSLPGEAAFVEGCDTSGFTSDLLEPAEYFVAIALDPLGGLPAYLRVRVAADGERILGFQAWAVSNDLSWQSDEPLITRCNVPVNGGQFSVTADSVVFPAPATEANVEAEVTGFALNGTISVDYHTEFCGVLDGTLVLLDQSLAGSPFRGVLWGSQTDPPEARCEGYEVPTYDPIAECPDIQVGENAMTSAELSRSFRVFLPDDIESGGPFPVLFAFHGLGGDSGFAESVSLDSAGTERGLIVISPDAARTSTGESRFPVDWNLLAAQFQNDNPDLVFFDDMLTCLQESYSVDTDRVYVTGMSAGGLWTTFLGLHRARDLAAVAPFSGGYLLGWPSTFEELPWLVTWGGVDDTAFDVDFNAEAQELIEHLGTNGNAYVYCNHGREHVYPEEMNEALLDFLLNYSADEAASPLAELPDSFPSYCTPQVSE
ncbi:MAG: hypothetical protein KC561_11140 [Myxococcales bacterium]|nr:hypothetical protein [Myxococcales bacterium]